MLRDKSLIPLSRQHQHALALCVRIDRADPVPEADLAAWQSEIAQHFRSEIEIHFGAEEKILFPSALRFPELIPLVNELLAEHAHLRAGFKQAQERTMSGTELAGFAQKLAAHIRTEERQLFERLQALMSEEELVALGKQLNTALEAATQSCALPNKTTKLRPAQ